MESTAGPPLSVLVIDAGDVWSFQSGNSGCEGDLAATSVTTLLASVDSAETGWLGGVPHLLHWSTYIPPLAVHAVEENDLAQQRKDGLQSKVSSLISPDGSFKHTVKAIGREAGSHLTCCCYHIYDTGLGGQFQSRDKEMLLEAEMMCWSSGTQDTGQLHIYYTRARR